MTPAVLPRHGPQRAKLLVVDGCGRITHHAAADLPSFIGRGDLIVANDAATLPASLAATHVHSGQPVEIRLAGRRSLGPDAVTAFTAVVFGAGDYRTPTERRPPPPVLATGDMLTFGALRATVTAVHDHPRLVDIRFHEGGDNIWAALARDGRPIHTPTSQNGSRCGTRGPASPHSRLPSRHHPPVSSSTGRRCEHYVLETRALRPSRTRPASPRQEIPISIACCRSMSLYVIPPATAALLKRTKQCGGRVLAVGTTVVRALEHAALGMGQVRSGVGVATGRIGAQTGLLVVDGIVSGMHEAGTSHYELLGAFQEDDVLQAMVAAAEEHDYRSHEFGDAVFVERFAGHGRRTPRDLCVLPSEPWSLGN